ncbi:MAG: diguanylate cyclase [Oscillospiraceae bacterium]
MKRNNFKKHIISIAVIFLSILWIIIAIFNFIVSSEKIQTNTTNKELEVIAQCNANEVRFTFERYIKTLTAVVKAVEANETLTSSKTLSILNNISQNDDFARLAIDSIEGISYTSDGLKVDITQFNYTDKIKLGSPFVIDVVDAVADGTPVVSVIIPIKNKDGVYNLALRGSIPTEKLTEVFDETFARSGGYYHVIDGNGRYISTGNSENAVLMDENYFDAIEKLTYPDGFSSQQIKKAFINKENGYTQYSYKGQERYAYYDNIGINNWVVLMILPKNVVETNTMLRMENVFWFVFYIVASLLLILIFTYFYQKRQRVFAQLNEKSFKVLAEQTNKAIFEWDFENKSISYLSNFKTLFGDEISILKDIDEAISSKTVHENDVSALKILSKAFKTGEKLSNIKLRIMDSHGIYHWCKISVIFINKQREKQYKAIGFIENIDEQVKKEQQLRLKSETDQLTGVYNKATSEYLIKDVISKSINKNVKHALLIIDVDNYKDINDNLGHLYGDIVLAQLASTLKSILKKDDIVGRLGGDEFYILIENYTSENVLINIAKKICVKFNKTYSKGDVSASVGISVFPTHGTTFEELYKVADSALYNVKAMGKNNFLIYDENLKLEHYISNRTSIDTLGKTQKNFYENKVEYLFNLMYNSENTELTTILILQLISEHFSFSRANILRSDENSNKVFYTYEWCSDGVPSIKNEQPDLTISDWKFIIDEFKTTDGMFMKNILDFPEHTHEIYNSLGIKSVLYFAIMEGDIPTGIIAFQNCKSDKILLTPNEFSEIKTICQMLSTFLLKEYSVENERQHHKDVETIMENIDGYAYVISSDDYKILFENEKVKNIIKSTSVGKHCYEVYMGSNKPCDFCPIKNLTKNVKRYTTEIENKQLNIISRTTAAQIDWAKNETAYLINSIDITEYKK